MSWQELQRKSPREDGELGELFIKEAGGGCRRVVASQNRGVAESRVSSARLAGCLWENETRWEDKDSGCGGVVSTMRFVWASIYSFYCESGPKSV